MRRRRRARLALETCAPRVGERRHAEVTTRERTVERARSLMSWMMVVSAGGSSRSFKKAFAASWLDVCGTMRSASPTTNTLRRAIAGVRAAC